MVAVRPRDPDDRDSLPVVDMWAAGRPDLVNTVTHSEWVAWRAEITADMADPGLRLVWGDHNALNGPNKKRPGGRCRVWLGGRPEAWTVTSEQSFWAFVWAVRRGDYDQL